MSASVYVFDAYGTVFHVHSAAARHRAEIGTEAAELLPWTGTGKADKLAS